MEVGVHKRIEEEMALRTPFSVRNQIISLFYHNYNVSLRAIAIRSAIGLPAVQNYLCKELKIISLQIAYSHALCENNESTRLNFAIHSRRELRNGYVQLHRINFFYKFLFSVSETVSIQNCRI